MKVNGKPRRGDKRTTLSGRLRWARNTVKHHERRLADAKTEGKKQFLNDVYRQASALLAYDAIAKS